MTKKRSLSPNHFIFIPKMIKKKKKHLYFISKNVQKIREKIFSDKNIDIYWKNNL